MLLKFSVILIQIAFLSFHAWSQTVAKVGSKEITLKDFNTRYQDVMKQTINPPTREQFLEDLIRYELGLQEARKRKLQNDPVVRDRMNQELYKALIEKELTAQIDEIKVSEAEMKRYYKKNPEIRTSHILTEFKPEATAKQIAAAKKRAKEIYDKVRKSKRDFSDLVAIYSDDALSKRNKGDVGWQNRITLVPSYYNTAYKMKNGQIKGLVRTQFGFHIIKKTGQRSYKEANKRSIRAAVFDEKRKGLFDAYFARVKKSYKISVNRKLIR